MRHEVVEPIARHIVCKPKGACVMRWIAFIDSYDLTIGAAIALLLAIIVLVAFT